MGNNEIGKLETFHQLLNEENTIIIPKIQRDYAYGRNEQKVTDILDGMLTGILEAVRDNKSNVLDFVYGGSYVKKNKVVSGLIPLDGQQRLTTLFLLHFYASLIGDEKGDDIDKSEVSQLIKFRYETRQSATEFCYNLVINIRDNLLHNYNPENQNIKELIIDDAMYLSTYNSDPTIISMLNVLDVIEKKCKELSVLNLSPCLWRRLIDGTDIQFYKLSLENFGLTDDLFIKMNARGKKLTVFEIFKSDMMAAIKNVSEQLKDVFSKKMDTEWVDIPWDYTDKTITDKRKTLDITNDFDEKYATLFQNIFRLEFYRRDLPSVGYKEPSIQDILSDEESINCVIDIFDTLYKIHKAEGFNGLWYKYFYFDDAIVGRDDLIRLFWKQKRMSVFELAINGLLTVPETVYLYSEYLLYKKNYDENTMKRCLRIIHNLMTGNVRAVDARTEKLPGFLQEVEYIIDHKGIDTYYDKEKGLIIDGADHKLCFLQNVWNEEFIKQNYFSDTGYEALMRYENHDILRCSLSLFMDYTLDYNELQSSLSLTPFYPERLIELLRKFETLFDDKFVSNFKYIRTLFLDADIDYMQYDPYMERTDNSQNTEKKRYFLSDSSLLSDFFIKNNTRKEQENILKILDKIELPENFSNLKDNNKFCIDDWKYYHVKYTNYCLREKTRYGMGVWDDKEKYPLDLIILNSSQHSKNNLEWMMLTNILWNLIKTDNSYQLDDHGCNPILLTKSASSIGFYKGKWNIETMLDIVPVIKEKHPDWILQKSENEQVITVNFDKDNNMDYVEMGKELISIIESIK